MNLYTCWSFTTSMNIVEFCSKWACKSRYCRFTIIVKQCISMNNKFLMINVNTLCLWSFFYDCLGAKCLLLLCTIKLYLVAFFLYLPDYCNDFLMKGNRIKQMVWVGNLWYVHCNIFHLRMVCRIYKNHCGVRSAHWDNKLYYNHFMQVSSAATCSVRATPCIGLQSLVLVLPVCWELVNVDFVYYDGRFSRNPGLLLLKYSCRSS